MEEWFYCSKFNHKVKQIICEARIKRGACIEKEVHKGSGANRIVEKSCEPKKKQSKEKREEGLILDMAMNGTYQREGGEE